MNIIAITSESQFLQLKDQWKKLNNEPLRSWEWNYYWWKFLGQDFELRIIVGTEGDRVVGIAPFIVESRKSEACLRFIGSGRTCTDYAQLIVADGYSEEFCSAIVDEVKRPSGLLSDVLLVELEGVSTDVNSFGLSELLGGEFWNYSRDLESTWVAELPEEWDEFLKQRCKSLRRKIRKGLKRYDSGEAVGLSTEEGLDFEAAFETLVELHQQRFVAKGEPGCFADRRFYDFLKHATMELHEQGLAHIVQCQHLDEVVATHICLMTENGFQMYQSGIQINKMEIEPGHLILTHIFKSAIERGYTNVDFLRGNERYKRNWGGKPTALYTVRCVSNRMSSTFKHQFIRGARQLKNWARDSTFFQKSVGRNPKHSAAK